MFDMIHKSKDHILYDYYKDLIYLYYYSANNKEMEFILHQRPQVERNAIQNIESLTDCEFVEDEFIEMDLFAIQTKSVDVMRKKRLQVKFRTVWRYLSFDSYNRRIGLPLFVWINKTDTLQYVIDKYMKDTKCYISCCSKINKIEEIVYETAIPKHEWDTFHIYFQMDLSKECLLFKIKDINHPNVIIPRYSNAIYQHFDQ
eukprot:544898_1